MSNFIGAVLGYILISAGIAFCFYGYIDTRKSTNPFDRQGGRTALCLGILASGAFIFMHMKATEAVCVAGLIFMIAGFAAAIISGLTPVRRRPGDIEIAD